MAFVAKYTVKIVTVDQVITTNLLVMNASVT